ncbi:hypothetical protein SAMN05444349_10278 [Bacteroides faecichinchillae]|uniref:Alpha-L-rhamnosidase six-hairpin glycosidase domain-containing protein n=1 Tax=Bacteroides faecichinchillae TaxID=871325 RepID=A0A1M4TCA4_9BACE|nr:hypothetical protein [Bacteroides faecichinchillae]THG56108.1 hypothetical protein E5981_17020 [Bacteroides faecichinchillae]SHE42132.1 hypothetical protein SAMN05444349_10278 [Bacteroides faecichinchillae]
MVKKISLWVVLLFFLNATSNAQQFWKIDSLGNSITWQVRKGEAHSDHIEMAGKRLAMVLRYGVNKEGAFKLSKSLVWPMLRTIPNNTHGNVIRSFDWNPLDAVTVNGNSIREQVKTVTLNGTMEVVSQISLGNNSSLSLRRIYFPSVDSPSLVEVYEFTNTGKEKVNLEIPEIHSVLTTDPSRGVEGSYTIHLQTWKSGYVVLSPGKSYSFPASVSAYKSSEKVQVIDGIVEMNKRKELVAGWMNNLVLETPEPVLNEMFAFSKIRACESIYETKSGPMHGPGGEAYYAAIWANDQAEYVNPYFPFVGYSYGNASALNSFRLFSKYINDEGKPMPSSIIAEGLDHFGVAGDRGDGAMVAYGAARYALARGSKAEAEELWPLIEWCLEFCRQKLNDKGVVTSDSDELENRFPSGKANLCTSSLYYDALLSAAYLAEDLGKGSAVVKKYREQAAQMEKNIDSYFASTVEGFDTYAYYEGNDILRSWICIPLVMGIDKRAPGTIDALFSPRLWTENGLLTQAGTSTFWDRSTLYALRGVFTVGEIEKAMTFLRRYSVTRLLGSHVPYAVEAWPEGNQRHLSAESGLYGRIFTEGMFGIRPTGLHSFSLTPRLPEEWDRMAFRKMKAFGADFDIIVERVKGEMIRIKIEKAGKIVLNKRIKSGTTVLCNI